MKFRGPIGILVALLLQWLPAVADDVITNIMSPVMSFQYAEDFTSTVLTNGGVQSPIVSYQYLQDFGSAGLASGGIMSPMVSYQYLEDFSRAALTNGGIMSPIVSYQYLEWPGDDVLKLLSSPVVSYFFNWGQSGEPLAFQGQVTDVVGNPVAGAAVRASVRQMAMASAQTAPDGYFELPFLPPAVYALTASATNYLVNSRVVSLGATTTMQNFVLKPSIPTPPIQDESPGQPLQASLDLSPSDNSSHLLVFDGNQWSSSAALRTNLPTVVLTHGWLMCVASTEDTNTAGVNDWPLDMARAFSAAFAATSVSISNKVNVVAWDWYNVARPCIRGLGAASPPPEEKTPGQGLELGKALYQALGSDYEQPIHFMGHSLGALVNSYALDYLFGFSRSGNVAAVPPWSKPLVEVTLFDEAAIARLLSVDNVGPAVIAEFSSGPQAALAAYGFTASEWKNPIPHKHDWLENYISAVGRYHEEGVNILLQRPIWEGTANTGNALINFFSIASDAHDYPIKWYRETMPPMGSARGSEFGWNLCLEHSLLDPQRYPFPPTGNQDILPPAVWDQRWNADEHVLNLATACEAELPPAFLALERLATSGTQQPSIGEWEGEVLNRSCDLADSIGGTFVGTLDWVGAQTRAGAYWAGGAFRRVGDVTVDVFSDMSDNLTAGVSWVGGQSDKGVNAVLDVGSQPNISAVLTTAPLRQLTLPQGRGLQDGPAAVNVPAYLWLPVIIPNEAQFMTFDFSLSGDGKQDSLVFGLNGTNVFALETQFIPTNGVQTSSPIDLGPYAGTTNEFFFGVVGGTSSNCSLTVRNIRLYAPAQAVLTIRNDSRVTLLSWPTTAIGFALEATPTLSPPAWGAVTNAPAIQGSSYVITNVWSDQTWFFRLRQVP